MCHDADYEEDGILDDIGIPSLVENGLVQPRSILSTEYRLCFCFDVCSFSELNITSYWARSLSHSWS